MYEDAVQDLDRGGWAERNPSKCPCKTRGGWLLSDFDTWHRCPLHGKNVPCPDDENAKFNYAGHWLYVLRTAYVEFRKVARRNGFRGSFKATCQACLPPNVTTPEAWVNAAEDVTVEYEARTALEEGRASGNGLEQRWAEDARDEQEQRFHDRG
jgi:hypothetical protein